MDLIETNSEQNSEELRHKVLNMKTLILGFCQVLCVDVLEVLYSSAFMFAYFINHSSYLHVFIHMAKVEHDPAFLSINPDMLGRVLEA